MLRRVTNLTGRSIATSVRRPMLHRLNVLQVRTAYQSLNRPVDSAARIHDADAAGYMADPSKIMQQQSSIIAEVDGALAQRNVYE